MSTLRARIARLEEALAVSGEIPRAEKICVIEEARGDVEGQREAFLAGLSQKYGIPRGQVEKLEGFLFVIIQDMARPRGDSHPSPDNEAESEEEKKS